MKTLRKIVLWIGVICFPILGVHAVVALAHTDFLWAGLTAIAFINLEVDQLMLACGYKLKYIPEA